MPAHKRTIEYQGRTQSLQEWADELEISESTLRTRIDSFNWSIEDALSTPAKTKFRPVRVPKGMPRPCPPVKEHKSGQAYCRWSSKGVNYCRYFGKSGTKEAVEAYRRFAIEWVEGTAELRSLGSGLLVVELAARYADWAERHYVKKGKVTSEYHLVRSAMRGLLAVVSDDDEANKFTTDDLRLAQTHFVGQGLARKTINDHIGRIVRAFRWASGRNDIDKRPLVNPVIVQALEAVEPLTKGRTTAREPERVLSVAWDRVEAIFPHLSKVESRRDVLERLIRFHWLTGMRSSQVLALRPCDLDRTLTEWCYDSSRENKNEHREMTAEYWIGPKAQEVIGPLLEGCPNGREVFVLSSREGRLICLAVQRYREIVAEACKRAGVAVWTPHQLRHSRATEVQRVYESDAMAAKAIGDSEAVAREVYIDPDASIKRRIARETG